jgi:putative tryptophan/tyrosine transport system substrate-binding protein
MRFHRWKRRNFITLLGGAAAWPLAARAQQPMRPLIGFISGGSPDTFGYLVDAFREGLGDAGFAEGRNVAIEFRWAEGRYDRLPALLADLVQRQVSVLAATTTPGALASKTATSSIPIVFATDGDPVQLGLASLNRPGGNVTGTTQLNVEVAPKRVELVRELIPAARGVALLINALIIASADPLFGSRAERLGALALEHRVPAIDQFRRFAASGGLASYGGSFTDSYRQVGVYAGRILKGEKPADLPVQQSTKVELILNLATANALGIEVPPTLLAPADEVIE